MKLAIISLVFSIIACAMIVFRVSSFSNVEKDANGGRSGIIPFSISIVTIMAILITTAILLFNGKIELYRLIALFSVMSAAILVEHDTNNYGMTSIIYIVLFIIISLYSGGLL